MKTRFLRNGSLLLAAVVLTWAVSAAAAAAAATRHGAGDDHGDALAFGHGLLWKVTGKGAAPGYLFGTIHSGDPRVTRLPAPVRKAFDASDVFLMEVVPDASLSEQMRRAMVFGRNLDLKQVVDGDLYDKVVAALAKYNIPEQMADRLKPWAAATTLSIPETARGVTLDQQLYDEAQRQGKSIFGIETAAEQIAVLNGMTLDDQLELLKGAVGTFDQRFKIYTALINDYVARDIDAIFALDHKYSGGDEALSREVEQRLFVERNRRIAKRIVPRFKAGKVFVAIGAGHLAGAQGVLSLLQRRGYTITRVY